MKLPGMLIEGRVRLCKDWKDLDDWRKGTREVKLQSPQRLLLRRNRSASEATDLVAQPPPKDALPDVDAPAEPHLPATFVTSRATSTRRGAITTVTTAVTSSGTVTAAVTAAVTAGGTGHAARNRAAVAALPGRRRSRLERVEQPPHELVRVLLLAVSPWLCRQSLVEARGPDAAAVAAGELGN